jgi:hypothetical protein
MFIFSFKALTSCQFEIFKIPTHRHYVENSENLDFATSIALKLKINITSRLSMADNPYLDPFQGDQRSFGQRPRPCTRVPDCFEKWEGLKIRQKI